MKNIGKGRPIKNPFCSVYHHFVYKTSLMKKLMFSYCILICLPLLLLTLFSYMRLSRTLVQQFQYSSNQSLQQVRIYLNEMFDEIVGATDMIAFHSTLSGILQKDTNSQPILETNRDYRSAVNVINDNLASETVHSIDLYVEEHPFYVSSQKQNDEGISFISIENSYAQELDYMLQNYYGKLLWFPRNIENPITKKDSSVITGTRYLKSTADYTTNIGILAINIRQSTLDSTLNRASVLPNSITLLIDEYDTLIAISDRDLFDQYSLTSELILNHLTDGQNSFRGEYDTFLLNSVPLTATDWTLVSIIPYEEILKTSKSTRNSLLLLMLIVSSLFYLAAYFISHMISQRLRNLSLRMKEVQFDNYSLIPSEDGTDEISDLINSHNHMLNRIDDYAKSQYQLGIALKTSELNALQAQINPHFLYNTLDLLHCIAWEHGDPEISEIVSLLARFYRLSLNKGKEMISVKDTIEQLEVYVKLQNFRFESSIQLTIELQPEIYNCQILKLLLQPIVENSIIHGILEKNIQKGTISIRGETTFQTLQFTITDDGIGMTEEELIRLINAADEKTSINTTSMGYGIKNVIERIHLYYGNEYGLTYKSQPGLGTTVILRIPFAEM